MPRALRVAAIIGMVLIAVAVSDAPVPSAAATTTTATGSVGIGIGGRPDVLAIAQIGLRGSAAGDLAPTHCTREILGGGTWLSVICTDLADDVYRPTLEGPAGLDFDYGCAPTNPASTVTDPTTITVSPDDPSWNCNGTIWTSDVSGPVYADIGGAIFGPPDIMASAILRFVDQDGIDHFAADCTRTLNAVDCRPTVAGTYRFDAAGMPIGAISEYACHTTSGPPLPTPTEIVVNGATGFVDCHWVISTPTVQVDVFDRDTNGVVAGVAVAVSGPGGDIPCDAVGSVTWMCTDLLPGTYDVLTNLASLPHVTEVASDCYIEPVRAATTAPPVQVGTTRANTFVHCSVHYRWVEDTGSPPTTERSAAPTTTQSGSLPKTGVDPTWPVAAAMVVLGAGLSRVTRRRVSPTRGDATT